MSKTDFQNGFALGMASGGVVEVVDTTEIDALETLIDESGVLEDTEGSVNEKAEELIKKAEDNNCFRFAIENATSSYAMTVFQGYKGNKVPFFSTIANANTSNMFKNAINIKTIDFYIDCPYSTNGSGMFYGTSSLKYIKGVNCSKMTNMTQMFVSAVEVIEEPLNVPNVTNYANAFSSHIKEIRFVSETIKVSISFKSASLLSVESIQSIIDGLATVTTAQTLTLNSAITLTDEQKATINAKGWTLAQ